VASTLLLAGVLGPARQPNRSGVQRRASNTGDVPVAGQKIVLGRLHRHRTLTVNASDFTLAIELDDGEVKVVRRTTCRPIRSIKAQFG
jgi:hypothetical protein